MREAGHEIAEGWYEVAAAWRLRGCEAVLGEAPVGQLVRTIGWWRPQADGHQVEVAFGAEGGEWPADRIRVTYRGRGTTGEVSLDLGGEVRWAHTFVPGGSGASILHRGGAVLPVVAETEAVAGEWAEDGGRVQVRFTLVHGDDRHPCTLDLQVLAPPVVLVVPSQLLSAIPLPGMGRSIDLGGLTMDQVAEIRTAFARGTLFVQLDDAADGHGGEPEDDTGDAGGEAAVREGARSKSRPIPVQQVWANPHAAQVTLFV
ncbi:hypothetical protein [Alicyclobacillus sp.]|uniref:hypothetical protein n=1 Tax=Alicyclobacillus sp. TaxID=61169 RepID=UPI0025C2B7AC|nr:hypothetical protein [Alicyclobacillus sp.]MCL6517890.1 hypothetical protein [Alicyclobacillus sp.]